MSPHGQFLPSEVFIHPKECQFGAGQFVVFHLSISLVHVNLSAVFCFDYMKNGILTATYKEPEWSDDSVQSSVGYSDYPKTILPW